MGWGGADVAMTDDTSGKISKVQSELFCHRGLNKVRPGCNSLGKRPPTHTSSDSPDTHLVSHTPIGPLPHLLTSTTRLRVVAGEGWSQNQDKMDALCQKKI